MRSFWIERHNRRGAAAVEFAIAAPLLLALLFALIEFSRGFMALHALEDAANRGCRAATCESGSAERVQEVVANVLSTSRIETQSIAISPATYPAVGQWEPVTVTVSVNFDDVSWLPLPRSLGGKVISGSATLPMETATLSSSSDWIGDRRISPP